MALAIALLLSGVLLPCWGEFALFKKGSTKAGSLVCSQRTCFTSLVALEANGARCSHHSECFSDCCLINLDSGGAFCAPRARITMTCLPQTRSAINIVCPCQVGLNCIHKDPDCSRRCRLI
ncbi:colipase-like protein 2 isoform X1 [Ovis aries]|uniref:Colipase like 2 n=1 Tax=Ovis aries TaxID=9940 RepID=A0AC11EGM6_SHEEP|nr:colipase-like protein 2 isoform X1 [Ovis aries]